MAKIKNTELVKRLKSESPDFFKKLQRIGLKLSAIGGLLMLFPVTLPAGSIILASAGILTFVSKLPTKDKISEEELETLKKELNSFRSKNLN